MFFLDITRQKRKVKAQTINISPLPGAHPWTDLHDIRGIEWRPRLNHPCHIWCQSAAALKVPFPILIRTTLTTVLHYRAVCDIEAFDWYRHHKRCNSPYFASPNSIALGVDYLTRTVVEDRPVMSAEYRLPLSAKIDLPCDTWATCLKLSRPKRDLLLPIS